MRIAATCHHCRARYRAPGRLAGRIARCRRCGQRFAIPLGGKSRRRARFRNAATVMIVMGLVAGFGIPALRIARSRPVLNVPPVRNPIVAPRAPDPVSHVPRAGEVLVVVRGVQGDDHHRAMSEAIRRLIGHIPGGRVVGLTLANDVLQARLKPAADLNLLRAWVDFGRVERAEAVVLLVEASPLRPDQTRPDESDPLGRAIFDLTSVRPEHRIEASRILASMPPAEDTSLRRYVSATLSRNLDEPDATLKVETIRALGSWATAQDLSQILNVLKGRDAVLRTEAIRALANRGDPRGSRAIAGIFPVDRAEAGRALIEMGPPAESATLALLRDVDESIRIDACRILAEIGTDHSLPALTQVAAQRSGPEARAARDAADAIVRRGGVGRN